MNHAFTHMTQAVFMLTNTQERRSPAQKMYYFLLDTKAVNHKSL